MTRKHALCIDTDPDNCRDVENVLNDLGYGVSIAANGVEGLEIARQRHLNLAFVSMDLEDTDALDLFEKLRAYHPNTMGIFLTTLPSGPAIFAAGRRGVHQIMLKPLQDADFLMLMD